MHSDMSKQEKRIKAFEERERFSKTIQSSAEITTRQLDKQEEMRLKQLHGLQKRQNWMDRCLPYYILLQLDIATLFFFQCLSFEQGGMFHQTNPFPAGLCPLTRVFSHSPDSRHS